MCGITGSVNADGAATNRAVLERMNLAIIHRGPDEDGFYVKDNVGMATRRLSIIDLAGGHQPISNEDGTKWIVFNGEIYNYQTLREGLLERGHKLRTRSDTEVVLHLYDEYGPDCLEQLRGMFALAIWDENDRSLFLARDRVGKKPLLYSHQSNGDLIFGSEFRALLEHPSISRDVDHDAIDNYMSYLCVPAPKTAFEQIRKLEPGHWLRWRAGQIKTKRYWLPDFSTKIKISEPEAIEETIRIMRESTRLRLISEVPLGAFLSGGVDSSIVVALMAQESSTPVKTFSIGFEEQDFSELKYARRVAEHVGAEYNEFIVRPDALEVLPTLVEHYGEPFADSSAIPTYYISRETRKHVTVALNGDGGDESFAGYERYAAMAIAEVYKQIPRAIRGALIEGPINLLPTSEIKKTLVRNVQRFFISVGENVPDRYERWMSTFKPAIKDDIYTADFAHSISRHQAGQVLNKWIAKANGTGLLDKMLLTDLMTYLPNDLLVKVDIASMANSLEARSPFLDHKVIEFAASLPEQLKMSRFRPKSLLKKVAAKLVPREVIYRPKMGFGVPVGQWFRGEMKGFVRDILLGEHSLNRGIVKREKIEEYVAGHTSGQADHSFQIWTLLMLELWYQRFID
jgi:asparagine synthase (glutamine-hydrolysing)